MVIFWKQIQIIENIYMIIIMIIQKIEHKMLSPYSSEIKKEYDIKTGGINKLAPNLMSKKNHVVHYRNLQYYLSEGLILKMVHRILEFKQSAWMKPYIGFNTQKRKATNEADKNLFKLLNNAAYGETAYGKYEKKNQNKDNNQ